MYSRKRAIRSSIKVNTSLEGETIEAKVRRITEQNEPIQDGAPQIFTDRKEGVLPEHDIRTDRFELAVETMDKVSKAKVAKRSSTAAEAKANDKTGKKASAKTDAKEAPKGGGSTPDSGGSE